MAIGSIAIFLASCGEDSTVENITQVNQSGIEVISDVSKLPKCKKDNDGEMVWVKGEYAPRKCTDSKWYAVAEGSVAATCTTKELKDKSGVKIICGGDSIGVVLNGKDGKDGKDGAKGEKGDKGDTGATGAQGKQGVAGKNGATGAQGDKGDKGDTGAAGAGCSMEKIDEQSVRVICGKDSSILYTGSVPSETTQDTVVLDSEKIAVSLDKVSGVTQKGPFLMGSRVLIREMEDGRTLTQTGNSFNGKIMNDRGEFTINARMLVSQYVMLEATGYYRNEVTGQNSSSELTLFAITDVNDRNIVNINLLTHLEYERVIYLVTQKKMKVRAAKKQAQKEVFGLLNIDATNFSNSEDLNIAGSSDEDGALLAFSLMFQGDRSVADLTVLLQSIANDMEKDGTWDDATTRMKIAEWSADADSAGLFAKVRNNVADWGLSSSVPNFEQFVRNFWYKEYGLGNCIAKNAGVVKPATAGKQKNTQTRYICKDDGSGNLRWLIASDIEKDTIGWGHKYKEGVVQNGQINVNKTYVYQNGNWRTGTALDSLLVKAGGAACLIEGDTSKVKYKDEYYVCTANIGTGVKQEWVVAPDFYNDTYEARSECKTTGLYGDGTLLKGRLHPEKMYACDNGKFRLANDAEISWNRGCVSYTRNMSVLFDGQYSYYWCGDNGWVYDFAHLNVGSLTDDRDGKTYRTIGIKTQMWMAENLNFDTEENYPSYCYQIKGDTTNYCAIYGRLYTWGVAMDSAGVYSDNAKGCGFPIRCKPTYPVRGICPKGWHLPTAEEWNILVSAVGDSITAGKFLKSSDGWANEGNGTDDYGMSILPAGYGGAGTRNKTFYSIEKKTDLWTSTDDGTGRYAKRVFITSAMDSVKIDDYQKGLAFAVRCVKDNPVGH